MENFELDALDLKILRLLQEDASLSIAEISERIGLSQTPCWKRLRRLETSGILKKRVALIDPRALGLRLTVLLTVRTIHHDAEWLSTFAEGVAALPEVVGFWRLSGERDYLLKVLVRDMEDYDCFYKRLIRIAPLADVSSSFVMEEIKSTTAIPI